MSELLALLLPAAPAPPRAAPPGAAPKLDPGAAAAFTSALRLALAASVRPNASGGPPLTEAPVQGAGVAARPEATSAPDAPAGPDVTAAPQAPAAVGTPASRTPRTVSTLLPTAEAARAADLMPPADLPALADPPSGTDRTPSAALPPDAPRVAAPDAQSAAVTAAQPEGVRDAQRAAVSNAPLTAVSTAQPAVVRDAQSAAVADAQRAVREVVAPNARPAPAMARANAAPARSLDALDPVFRTRLERVLGRVERELGYEVRVLETYRTPARQEALYEQGRTRPGPIVTWTRNSLHSEGRATDLLLVGAGENQAAYARLGEIAAEEGLRTLGPRDPGHVELPRSPVSPLPPAAAGASAVATNAVQRVLEIARTAGRTVPRAEDVSAFARELARTALAAGPHVPPAAESPHPKRPSPSPSPSPSPAALSASSPVPRPAAVLQSEPHAAPDTAPARAPAAAHAAAPDRDLPSPGPVRDGPVEAGGAAPPSPVPAVHDVSSPQRTAPISPDLAQRIERLAAVQETLASQPVHSVLLRLDEPGGALAHVRVGVRGGEVSAAVAVEDAGLAGMLRTDLPELQRALERQGLDPLRGDALRVLSGALGEGSSPAPRNADAGGTRTGSDGYRQPQGDRQPQQQRSRGQHDHGRSQRERH